MPVIHPAAGEKHQILPDREGIPAVSRGILPVQTDIIVSRTDVKPRLRLVVLGRIRLDGERVHVDPLRVVDLAEQPEGGRGDVDVVLFVGVLRPLLVEEGTGFGQHGLPRDSEDVDPLFSEGKTVLRGLDRLHLRLRPRADEEGGDFTDYEQPDDEYHRNY